MTKPKKIDKRKLPVDKREAPTQGQHAPKRELPWEECNKHEQAVLLAFSGSPRSRKPLPNADIVKVTGLEWRQVSNAYRRLVQGGWLEQAERGHYRLTIPGANRLIRRSKKGRKNEAQQEMSV